MQLNNPSQVTLDETLRNKQAVAKYLGISVKTLDRPMGVSWLQHSPCSRDKASCALDGLDEAIVQAYKQQRRRQASNRGCPMSIASMNRELATLQRALRLAQEWKVIDRVPRIRLLSGEQGRDLVLTYEQEKLYLGSAPQSLHDLALMILDTGLRIGEALNLEWPDVRIQPAAGASLLGISAYGRSTARIRRRGMSP